MIKLLEYQQKGLSLCNSDFTILNWCRNSGKTFMIPVIIENNDMKNCIYYGYDFNYLKYKIEKFTPFKVIEINRDIICFKKHNQVYSIKNGESINLNKQQRYDCIFYDEYLPCLNNIKAEKIVCTLTINNNVHWIESLFPTAKVMNIDYNEVVKNKLLNKKILFDCLNENNGLERFKEEYGILQK